MSIQAPEQTEAKASAREMVPSISDGHFDEMIRCSQLEELQELFDRVPLEGIRRRIIRVFQNAREQYVPDWYQVRIRQLVSSKDSTDIMLGAELLRVNMFWRGQNAWKALEFALGLQYIQDRFDLHKNMLALIKRDPKLYWSVPGMREYILSSLSDLPKVSSGTIRRGSVEDMLDEVWPRLERALNCILLARDVTAIEHLSSAGDALSALVKSMYTSEGSIADNLDAQQKAHAFHGASKLLTEEKKNQWSDLFETVGMWIKVMRPLKEFVRVHAPDPYLKVESVQLRQSQPFGTEFFYEVPYTFCFSNDRQLEDEAFLEDLAKLRIEFDGSDAQLYACLEHTYDATRKASSTNDRQNSLSRHLTVWNIHREVSFRLHLRKGVNRVEFKFGFNSTKDGLKTLTRVSYVEVV